MKKIEGVPPLRDTDAMGAYFFYSAGWWGVEIFFLGALQYTRYPSTAIGSSLAVNDCTLDILVTSDRPSTP